MGKAGSLTGARRRIVEIALVVAILGVLVAIGLRLFVAHDAMRARPHFGRPSVQGEKMTVPDRPHDVGQLMEHPESIRRRRTYTWSTEEHGYRNPPMERDKPAGGFRLAVVGECVAFGNGVNDDEAWPARLQALLAERLPGRPVEVINASVPAPPPDVFRRLGEVLGQFQVDLVIVSPGADLIYPEHIGPEGSFHLDLPEARYQELLGSVSEKSRQGIAAIRARNARAVLVTPTFNSFALPDGDRWIQAVKDVGAAEGVPVLDTSALFRVRERQDGLVFERDDQRQRLLAFSGGQPRELLAVDTPRDGWVSSEIYAYLDAHPEAALRLSIDENHPNPEGHKLIAAQMLALLEQQNLLPGS